MKFFNKGTFFLRFKIGAFVLNYLSVRYFRFIGMEIGKSTTLRNPIVTWPHQVSIGDNCNLEHHIYLKFDGIWSPGPSIILRENIFVGSNCEFNIRKGIVIGNNSLIGSGSRFIDHDHGIEFGQLIGKQLCPEKNILIGEDVWIGCNVIILKGVVIGDGAVIAAGAVVNKSVPSNEVWGGVPAKKIGQRNS